MATPMSAGLFLAALRAEGLTVREHAGWATHNRAGHGAWGPLNGVMIHHTAGAESGADALCYNGRTDLPGPLCHGVIHKDGTITLVGWGRANHAGAGDPDALAAVVAESSTHPRPNTASVDGNARFVGFECVNRGDGKDPWPEKQLDAIARAAAAVCRHYGWSAQSVIGHLEWTSQKIDPRGFTMASMRSRVAALLAKPPGKTTVPAASTSPIEETPMAMTPEDVWAADCINAARPPYENSDYETNRKWTAGYTLQTIIEGTRHSVREARDGKGQAQANGAAISALTAEVAEVKALLQRLVDGAEG